jgi:hypothetical protein
MQLELDFNRIDERSADSFNYAQHTSKPFGELDPVIQWCRQNLTADWRWQMVSLPNDRDPGDYIFYFDSEEDYFMFTMRWR